MTGQGLPELVAELAQRAKDAAWVQDGQLTLVHDRQRRALKEAADALRNAGQFGADQLELRAESLRLASKALDRLIGRIEPDQVLDVVFSRFCIGK
jgi:tRNA modification GTPase